MIELLYTLLVLIGFMIPIDLLFHNYIYPTLILRFGYSFSLEMKFLLQIYYELNYQNIQGASFSPITNISPLYYNNETFSSLDLTTKVISDYSIIKTEEYSNECLKNFF